jgi:hypothetical protein
MNGELGIVSLDQKKDEKRKKYRSGKYKNFFLLFSLNGGYKYPVKKFLIHASC